MRPRVVETPHGRVAGRDLHGVAAFLGLPYAAPPVGPLRLRAPRPPATWAGVRDASQPGPACLQALHGNQRWLYEPVERQSEDCLYLNVWTPGVGGRRPVLVWVHGGQTRNGHGAAVAFDGTALARDHGVVVVTINYRLGALGGLAHPDLADGSGGPCANWGLQDKLAALAWVRGTIAEFGGDPGNVTLAGQSSGAANVALIAQHGLARDAWRRIVLHSPPLFRPPMFADLDLAAEYTALVAKALDVPVRGLRDVAGEPLQRAEQALSVSPEVTARMGRPRTAPVRDGSLLRHWTYDAPAAPCPVLAGWTREEGNFWFDLRDEAGRALSTLQAPATDEALVQRTAALLAAHYAFPDAPDPAAVVRAYREAGDAAAAWCALYTDLVFRAPIAHFAARQAAAGYPVFVYEFARPLASGPGSPHAADVPFLFGTHDAPHFRGKIAADAAASALSASMQAAWARFAAEDVPTADGAWPRWDARAPRVMQLGPVAMTATPLRDAARLHLFPAYGSAERA